MGKVLSSRLADPDKDPLPIGPTVFSRRKSKESMSVSPTETDGARPQGSSSKGETSDSVLTNQPQTPEAHEVRSLDLANESLKTGYDFPMRIIGYHGTRSEFEQFAAGGCSGASLAARGLGFYFWADIRLAEPFAGEDGRVIEVEITLANPAILAESETPGQEASADEARAFSEALKEAGHDGLIVEHGFSGPEIVVFDPDCIRIINPAMKQTERAAARDSA